MKKYLSIVMVFVSLTLGCPRAFAQWDYNDHVIDNIVQQRIEARNMRKRMEARHKTKGGKTKTARTPRKATKVARKVTAPLPHGNISILRDTYQDFHMNDRNGYVVTFKFAPSTGEGAPIIKTYRYAYLQSREQAQWDDLPPATYTITAFAVYNGKRFPVQMGTRNSYEGSDFGPSVKVVVKPAKDSYGTLMVQSFPDTIYLHVVE